MPKIFHYGADYSTKTQKIDLQIFGSLYEPEKSQKEGLLDLEPIYILEKVDFSSTTEVLLRMM